MKNLRKYGQPPFTLAVVHGGPGAPGEMAPVARRLAVSWGVLEPLQTATSLPGQVEELKVVLEKNGATPLTLIGYSWGAWLSFILAAQHPALVKKLILVSSGGYQEQHAVQIQETRLSRLSPAQRAELESLRQILDDPQSPDKGAAFARFGALFSQIDTYDFLPHESEVLEFQYEVFASVWPQAAEMRRSGELLGLGKRIRCPVVAIHGDYDPHPAEGVREPLAAVLEHFRFVLLARCGHTPWYERQAKDEFYRVLQAELSENGFTGVYGWQSQRIRNQ
jgi:pimeloyl-ACP methyl ester carboxylesterase